MKGITCSVKFSCKFKKMMCWIQELKTIPLPGFLYGKWWQESDLISLVSYGSQIPNKCQNSLFRVTYRFPGQLSVVLDMLSAECFHTPEST